MFEKYNRQARAYHSCYSSLTDRMGKFIILGEKKKLTYARPDMTILA
jgi:hypothetical protein